MGILGRERWGRQAVGGFQQYFFVKGINLQLGVRALYGNLFCATRQYKGQAESIG